MLFGISHPKTSKWADLLHIYPGKLESRNMVSFHGKGSMTTSQVFVVEPAATEAPLQASNTLRPVVPVQVPVGVNDLEKFRWDGILREKIPRDYQLVAYIEALLNDTVLVLPTGSGKTLVASLVLGKMAELNPDKMGLFLVHRVPLICQQANVIRNETGLKVHDLSYCHFTGYQIEQVFFTTVIGQIKTVAHAVVQCCR